MNTNLEKTSSGYAELQQKSFVQNKPEELFIKSEIKNPVLKEFLNRLEDEYGCLLTNMGCTTNGKWLSVKAITVLVSELDKDWSNLKCQENADRR